MIILICLVLGLMLRQVTSGSIRTLSSIRLRGEALLLGLLVAQAGIPALQLTGVSARIAFYGWLATFPCMVAITWMNRRLPGMAVLGTGLLLNFVVIALNAGMPVFPEAIAAIGTAPRALAIPSGDFVHVIGTAATRLPWLADILALPGPAWVRLIASPGDVLLYVGIVAFLGVEIGQDTKGPRDE